MSGTACGTIVRFDIEGAVAIEVRSPNTALTLNTALTFKTEIR
jgi:hypothetical protein